MDTDRLEQSDGREREMDNDGKTKIELHREGRKTRELDGIKPNKMEKS